MKLALKEKRLSYLLIQRNVLAGLSVCLLGSTLLLSIAVLFKSEKTIIAPLELEHKFWVEGNRFSPEYLEDMAGYYTHLILDVSPSNILYQGDVILRSVEPAFHGAMKQKLFEDHARLKKENLSLSFAPTEFHVYPDNLSVEVTGDLMSYVSNKKIAQHRETYRLGFSSKGSRLFLKSFSLIASDKKEDFNNES